MWNHFSHQLKDLLLKGGNFKKKTFIANFIVPYVKGSKNNEIKKRVDVLNIKTFF